MSDVTSPDSYFYQNTKQIEGYIITSLLRYKAHCKCIDMVLYLITLRQAQFDDIKTIKENTFIIVV